MMPNPRVMEQWEAWRKRAREQAQHRWKWALTAHQAEWDPRHGERPDQGYLCPRSGKSWAGELRGRLARLTELGILLPREQTRVKEFRFQELPSSDRDRLRREALERHLFCIGLANEPTLEQPMVERALRLADGRLLRNGRLRLRALVDSRFGTVVDASMQLQGREPRRGGRDIYLRYDLDVQQLGTGPVAHFNAHWHQGRLPDEDKDPRLPSLVLDPLDALDVLVETFFPNGPEDIRPVPLRARNS